MFTNFKKIWSVILKILVLAWVIAIATIFRFTDLNWDSDQHLHPDERFLTMVTDDLKWPKSWTEYFTTQKSPLNPHNMGHGFYVYGTWPVVLVKALAERLQLDNYQGITQVGRATSASAELLTVILVILTAAQLAPTKKRYLAGLVAGFCYAILVLPIQLAHFYVVDPYLTLALSACFFGLSLKPKWSSHLWAGIWFGLALSAKVSAGLFLPIILGRYLQLTWNKTLKLPQLIGLGLIFGVSSALTLRIAYPILFESQGFWPTGINHLVLQNWQTLKAFDGVETGFPPGLQWIPTQPISYLLTHTILWAIGIPEFLLGLWAVGVLIRFRHKLTQPILVWLCLAWVIGLSLYQSLQFAKTLRYIYPMLPFFTTIIGVAATQLSWRWKNWTGLNWLAAGLSLTGLWWSSGFQTIYHQPHTRVVASEWIYEHFPDQSVISYEYWDDGLPLSIGQDSALSRKFLITELALYDNETLEKWQKLSYQLAQLDYIVLSSNRLWRSISALPKRYPVASRYYRLLFSEALGFKKIAQFSNYPCLWPQLTDQSSLITPALKPPPMQLVKTPTCAMALADDGAEEAFTVYDHPTVLIFENTNHFSASQINRLLLSNQNLPAQ
ncbi:MAG TPA: hypothetical protein DEP87_01565 [Candidatus Pacebacteria bacterium]|nr:hypothetical protein [Candidatus Paceibacterota bacterium]